MYGYIIANKPELKFREFDVYRGYYCGLCKCLRSRSGNIARLSLSYDMTFLYILLTGLYEPKTARIKEGCILHPLEKQTMYKNECADYVADMSLLMTYYKSRDDWRDDGRLTGKLMMDALKNKNNELAAIYPQKLKCIAAQMKRLDEGERADSHDIDYMAGAFGNIMGEIFAMRDDRWEQELRRMGFYLGKFIYLMDAYDDIERDIKKKHYNPFADVYAEPDFEAKAGSILIMMMSECSRAFEKLPIIKNAELLRNILYSGVWVRYEKIKKERAAARTKCGNQKKIYE